MYYKLLLFWLINLSTGANPAIITTAQQVAQILQYCK
jgi:hypothetical protein